MPPFAGGCCEKVLKCFGIDFGRIGFQLSEMGAPPFALADHVASTPAVALAVFLKAKAWAGSKPLRDARESEIKVTAPQAVSVRVLVGYYRKDKMPKRKDIRRS